mmetsp:Transcript_32657/g.55049  ORF Transcript_32657/g.55049 Transcript_32657/m.55049 type:complete len:203 (-) Transcript_32657:356-964(-)
MSPQRLNSLLSSQRGSFSRNKPLSRYNASRPLHDKGTGAPPPPAGAFPPFPPFAAGAAAAAASASARRFCSAGSGVEEEDDTLTTRSRSSSEGILSNEASVLSPMEFSVKRLRWLVILMAASRYTTADCRRFGTTSSSSSNSWSPYTSTRAIQMKRNVRHKCVACVSTATLRAAVSGPVRVCKKSAGSPSNLLRFPMRAVAT